MEKRRKQLRAAAKGYIDKENEEEGETYISGAFLNNLNEFIFEKDTVVKKNFKILLIFPVFWKIHFSSFCSILKQNYFLV